MGKKPSYIDRMEHFILNDMKRLSPSEINLFLALFHLNNRAMWAEWFEATNIMLTALTELSENNMIRAKNGLRAKNFIDYKPGRRGHPSQYRLYTPEEHITLSNYTVQIESKTERVSESETERVNTVKRPKPQGFGGPLRHKTKDIRHRESRKKQVFSPPTLEEVAAYIQEKNLPIDPKYFFDYFTEGNWHDSNGKQVRSWKQKALTWARHNKQEPAPSEIPSIEEQREWQRKEEERQLAYIKRLGARK